MEEKMMKLAEMLLQNDNVINVFNELEKILDKNGLYQELAACKERIWHLNGDNSKLKEMAVLYREKLNNPDNAYVINMLYLRRTDIDLYNQIVSCFQDKNITQIIPPLDDNSDKFSDLWKIADRYCGLYYIVVILNFRKMYDSILKILPFFNEIKKIADDYIKSNPEADTSDMSDIGDCDRNLSILLAIQCENLELCKLAVKYDEDNEKAYANLIEYYINNSFEKEAFDFYNNDFRGKFNKIDNDGDIDREKYEKADTYIDVIWELSKFYYKNFDIYKSLYFQKTAIDYELEHQSCEDAQS